jgi:hypothetical protein
MKVARQATLRVHDDGEYIDLPSTVCVMKAARLSPVLIHDVASKSFI